MKNYYEILGIAQTATESEIKKAYRQLAKKYHPDANAGSKESEERFKEVAEAYKVLQDPSSREAYDNKLSGRQASKPESKRSTSNKSPSGQSREFSVEDLEHSFERFFGFHPKQGTNVNEYRQKKSDKNPMDTTHLFESFFGTRKKQ